MAYTDDSVLAKLSALNETQESIVTVAQWVMFHRRHAERTAQLWIQRLKDSSSSKRLNLIYLANEVAQQSKVRRKDDFLVAFSPIIAEATAVAYKGATNEIQQKLRRVVEVWRQRQIFEVPIQEAIETRIDDLDKSRSSNRKPLFGSSLGSSSVPPEIQPLIPLQGAVTKLPSSTKTAVDNAKQEYMKTTDPSTTLPTPPVYAARLSGLLKTLANAEGAVAEGIKARRALVEALEKLLDVNRNALSQDEAQHLELANWKAEIDQKKRDVEDSIMRGLAEEASPSSHANGSPGSDNAANRVARDSISSETERAPSVEALTPTGTPPTQTNFAPRATASDFFEENPKISPVAQQQFVPAAGSDLLSSLAMPFGRPAVGSQANGSSAKKRKLNDADDFPGLGGDDALAGLDDDVAEMLRRDSGGF